MVCEHKAHMYNQHMEQSARSTSRLSVDSSSISDQFSAYGPSCRQSLLQQQLLFIPPQANVIEQLQSIQKHPVGLMLRSHPNNINVRYTRSCDVMCCPGTAHTIAYRQPKCTAKKCKFARGCKNINVICCFLSGLMW